jgi:hypothetical protein
MTASILAVTLLVATVPAPPETIYVGTVFPLKGAASVPTYVYERSVESRDGAMVSSHVTRDLAGAVQLQESATHAEDYRLASYTLHRNQLGQSGTVRVDGDQVSFERRDGTQLRRKTERQAGPVVVGPTLVGYVYRHLDALRGGQVLGVRMAVLDRLETIGFDLQAVPGSPGQTRIRMKPSSFFVALVVDPIYFTFEADTGKLVRLEGRVPPKVRQGESWRDFDARVEYRFVAAAYR